MTTTFVDTAGPGDAEAPPKRLRTAEPIIPMNGLFAAQDIKAGTIVAHYQLMVVPNDKQAESIWEKVKAGQYKSLLKAIQKREPALKIFFKNKTTMKKQWDKTFKILKRLKPVLLDQFNDYVVSHKGLEFYPDLSFGIDRNGLLCSEAIETIDGRPYPGLSGMFSNEPGIDQTENVVPMYYESMKAPMNGQIDPTSLEGARTPRLFFMAKEYIPKGAEIVWCYGSSYGDRGYTTGCGKTDELGPNDPNPISDTMLDAIVICCLFDVSGAVQAIAEVVNGVRPNERIWAPGEMAELYKRSRKDNDLTVVRRAKRPAEDHSTGSLRQPDAAPEDRFAQIQRMVDEYIKTPPSRRARAFMESVQDLLFQMDSKLQSE